MCWSNGILSVVHASQGSRRRFALGAHQGFWLLERLAEIIAGMRSEEFYARDARHFPDHSQRSQGEN
jgi:hypothetical protein